MYILWYFSLQCLYMMHNDQVTVTNYLYIRDITSLCWEHSKFPLLELGLGYFWNPPKWAKLCHWPEPPYQYELLLVWEHAFQATGPLPLYPWMAQSCPSCCQAHVLNPCTIPLPWEPQALRWPLLTQTATGLKVMLLLLLRKYPPYSMFPLLIHPLLEWPHSWSPTSTAVHTTPA